MTDSKYITVEEGGRSVRRRDPAALRADILQLLASNGAMGKRRIINALRVGQYLVGDALKAMHANGEVESYRAMSVRNRMDELWCLAGQSPARMRTQFGAARTLAALQHAAAASLGILNPTEQPA